MDFEAYSGNEPFVFISYAHADTETVEPILRQLCFAGVRFWFDKGLRSGNWYDQIGERISACRIMLVFFSKNVQRSKDCKREVALADMNHKDYIVIRMDNTEMSGTFAYLLSSIQYKDAVALPARQLVSELMAEEWAFECSATKKKVPILEPSYSNDPSCIYWNGTFWKNKPKEPSEYWGPERKMYQRGNLPRFAVLNSEISDQYGDERYFIGVQEAGAKKYLQEITVVPGKTYDVRVLFHNNAAFESNKSGLGIATNVRVAVQLPIVAFPNRCTLLKAGLRANVLQPEGELPEDLNSIPPKDVAVWSSVKLHSGEVPVFLEYLLASAYIETNGKANGTKLSSSLFTDQGHAIGYNVLKGVLPGGDRYAGYIHFQFVAYSPNTHDIIVERTASLDGSTWSQDSIRAKVGQYICFRTTIYNNSYWDIDSALLREELPDGLELLDNAKLYDVNHTGGQEISIPSLSGSGIEFSIRKKGLIQLTTQARVDAIPDKGLFQTKSTVLLNGCTVQDELAVETDKTGTVNT